MTDCKYIGRRVVVDERPSLFDLLSKSWEEARLSTFLVDQAREIGN